MSKNKTQLKKLRILKVVGWVVFIGMFVTAAHVEVISGLLGLLFLLIFILAVFTIGWASGAIAILEGTYNE